MRRIEFARILLVFIAACTPTIRVQAPDKPIEINLNVKIEHEIRIKVDRDLDELFEDETELFAIISHDGVKGTLVMSYSAVHFQNIELIKQIQEIKNG